MERTPARPEEGEQKSSPRTTSIATKRTGDTEALLQAQQKMAAMEAEMKQMKAKIKQMEEAANKVMDSHKARQLALHLAVRWMAKLNVGFVVGMQVCLLEKKQLRTGEVTSVSAMDGVTVRYARGSEDYIPTKLKKCIAAADKVAAEKAAEKRLQESRGPDALVWSPTMGSVEKALAEAKKWGVKIVYLERGEFVVESIQGTRPRTALIDFSIIVKGVGQGNTVVKGGFYIKGQNNVRLETMTVTNQRWYGLWCDTGTKVEGKELTIKGENAEYYQKNGGVFVSGGAAGECTLTDCIVTNCGGSGIIVMNRGVLHMYGERTKVTGNCKNGDSGAAGLVAYHEPSKIFLHAPLTKESVSCDNVRNWRGESRITETSEAEEKAARVTAEREAVREKAAREKAAREKAARVSFFFC